MAKAAVAAAAREGAAAAKAPWGPVEGTVEDAMVAEATAEVLLVQVAGAAVARAAGLG